MVVSKDILIDALEKNLGVNDAGSRLLSSVDVSVKSFAKGEYVHHHGDEVRISIA